MGVFPEALRFRHPWRAYQRRVLDEFARHAADGHFHLVAAPGAGKTVLGLEIVRRLDRPALVLAPSLGIRDQWTARYRIEFTPHPGDRPDLSTDLRAPAALTVTTYQALGAWVEAMGAEAAAGALRAAGVATLVCDESHHLRKRWWKDLFALKKALGEVFVVALTATPPYDVAQVEWNRYAALCGVLDEEISVPELVRSGDLCPHQDLVHLCRPTEAEREAQAAHAAEARRLTRDLCLNAPFLDAVRAHPLMADPDANAARLADRPDFALSLALFLHHATGELPEALRGRLGLKAVNLPRCGLAWFEVLLSGLLFPPRDEPRPACAALDDVEQRLRRLGAVARRQVWLRRAATHGRRLRNSPAKVAAVGDILEAELRHRGPGLRAAVLADFIRKEELALPGGPDRAPERLGVVPLFRHLRRLRLPDLRLGVVTGGLLIVPEGEAAAALEKMAARDGLPAGSLVFTHLPLDADYAEVRLPSDTPALRWFTELLAAGHVNALIGTASLLGEGWDAPVIDTLILATARATHVSANQLRGRAIRHLPGKAANIWHLACVDPEPGGDTGPPTGGDDEETADDLPLLARRFQNFAGLHRDIDLVESGLDRLGLVRGKGATAAPPRAEGSDAKTTDRTALNEAAIRRYNARTFAAAQARDDLPRRWRQALVTPEDKPGRLAQELFIPAPRLARRAIHVLGAVPARGLFRFVVFWMLQWRLSAMSRALLEALRETKLLETSAQARPVIAFGRGGLLVRLAHASRREEDLFVDAMAGLFRPMDDPRYVIATRHGVFAVPEALGRRKALAEVFARQWSRRVARARLASTRSAEGAALLLRAKEVWLLDRFEAQPETIRRWVHGTG